MYEINNKKIVLIGGGGHCRSVIDSIIENGSFDDIVITDKEMTDEHVLWTSELQNNGGDRGRTQKIKVAGDDTILPELYNQGYRCAALTVGQIHSSVIRRNIFESVKNIGFFFPTIIDTSVRLSSNTYIGIGGYLGKNCIVNTGTTIGDFSIINTGAIVDHNCVVKEFSHIAVGAVICGGVEVGADVLVGANATVIQGVKIGNRSIIGAGSIVLTDVPDDTVAVGVWKERSRSTLGAEDNI